MPAAKRLVQIASSAHNRTENSIKDIEIKKRVKKIQKAIYAEFDKVEIYLWGAFDEAKKKEKVTKEAENMQNLIKNLEARLKKTRNLQKSAQADSRKRKRKTSCMENRIKKIWKNN